MKRLTLAAAVGLAFASGAWGQAPPSGTYQFTSGPGVGTAPFTVTGFSTSLGGSIGLTHLPNCSGLHVHGVFNGFADPASGGCGHGIIAMIVAPPSVSGGSLPGGMPTNIAGQLALTTPAPGVRVDVDILRGAALGGFALPSLGVAVVVEMFQGRSTDGQTVNFVGGEVGGTVMDLERSATSSPPAGNQPATGNLLKEGLANPAQRVLSSPAATSWLEEFAAYNVRAGDGYRRDAEKTQQQSDEWRKLADDARRDAERNRQRADDARKDGRDTDARNWDEEAQRDRAEAERRDRESQRLGDWSDEMREREAAARAQAEARRAAAEAARERVRQAERDRVERIRQAAEEKARLAQEARDERLRRERAEADKRIQELQDRVRARQIEDARKRAAAEREHRQWLAEQEAQRNARARGSSSDADLAAGAARAAAERKKKEEEEKTWADYVIAWFDSGEGEAATDKAKEMIADKLMEEGLERSGVTSKLDKLGAGELPGKIVDGVKQVLAVKKFGEELNKQMDLLPGRQQRIMDKEEGLFARQATSRELRSGSLSWRETLDTVVPIIKASQ